MLNQHTPGSFSRQPPAQQRYTGPTARDIADLLPGSRPQGQGFRLRGLCHGHGDVPDSASLQVQDSTSPDGGLVVKCWAGCNRREIINALEQATGLRIWDAWEDPRLGIIPRTTPSGADPPVSESKGAATPSTAKAARNGPSGGTLDMTSITRRTWNRDSQPIPADPDHPARLWLNHRHLWRPGFPLPSSLRWLPAEAHYQGRGKHTGAGSLVALAAPPEAWSTAWPDIPVPQAVQLIAIDAQGSPALDRPAEAGGLGKRSLGSTTGMVVVFGCPDLAEALEPVRVAEGVADALALASRYPGPAVATLGTSTMTGDNLPRWLAAAVAGTVLHVDADAGGEDSARQLRRHIQALGGTVRAVLPAEGKDAAEAAAGRDFQDLPAGWEDYAATLRDTTSWPRWEIARQAVTMMLAEEGRGMTTNNNGLHGPELGPGRAGQDRGDPALAYRQPRAPAGAGGAPPAP